MLGIFARAEQAQARVRSLVRLKVELAQLEMRRKGRALGIAFVLGVVALVLVLYAIGFAFAAAATAIDEVLPLWGSLLIVSGFLALAAIVIAYVATRVAKTASPPRPVVTVEESQKTAIALRRHA